MTVLSSQSASAFFAGDNEESSNIKSPATSIAQQYKARLRVPMDKQASRHTYRDYDTGTYSFRQPSANSHPYPMDNDQSYYLPFYGEQEQHLRNIVDADENHTYRYYTISAPPVQRRKRLAQLNTHTSGQNPSRYLQYPLFFDQ